MTKKIKNEIKYAIFEKDLTCNKKKTNKEAWPMILQISSNQTFHDAYYYKLKKTTKVKFTQDKFVVQGHRNIKFSCLSEIVQKIKSNHTNTSHMNRIRIKLV